MKEQLPNLRLLLLESGEWGRDWQSLSNQLDQKLEDKGLELSVQDIYIQFISWPKVPQVLVGRSFIGPLIEMESPFIVNDWETAEVDLFPLQSVHWEDFFTEVAQIKAQNQLGSDFVIVFKRRIVDEKLEFIKQVLFR